MTLPLALRTLDNRPDLAADSRYWHLMYDRLLGDLSPEADAALNGLRFVRAMGVTLTVDPQTGGWRIKPIYAADGIGNLSEWEQIRAECLLPNREKIAELLRAIPQPGEEVPQDKPKPRTEPLPTREEWNARIDAALARVQPTQVNQGETS